MATNNSINLRDQGIAHYDGSGTFSAPTLTTNGVVIGAASNNVATISVGAANSVLTGSGGSPSFSTTPTLEGLTLNTTPLAVGSGGTGASTLTDGGVLLGSGSSAVTATSALTDGQLLIGNTGSDPSLAQLTSGTGISISNGSGTITINSIGSGITWNVETTSTALAVNNGYIANGAGITFTLPSTASVGDVIEISGISGDWTIAQNASQLIHFGNQVTTTGVGGSLASTNASDSVKIVCAVTNTTFVVLSSIGNITIV